MSKAQEGKFKGQELYTKVDNFFTSHTIYVCEASMLRCFGALDWDVSLVQNYVDAWLLYQYSSELVDIIFSLMNEEVTKCPEKGIHKIYQLALVAWRENLFKHIVPQMTSTISLYIRVTVLN